MKSTPGAPRGALSNFQELQRKIKYEFKDVSLLTQAMTHSSWTNEHDAPHNERLEFLGDAVLEINISRVLFDRFPDEREGSLTAMRSALVSEPSLAAIAKGLKLGAYLLMGRGEEAQGGRLRDALVADALEALIGAAFLDGGHPVAEQLVTLLFKDSLAELTTQKKKKDCKTLLQEKTQAVLRTLPVYTLLESTGPEHARRFKIRLELSDGTMYEEEGTTIKQAEQKAAQCALKAFS